MQGCFDAPMGITVGTDDLGFPLMRALDNREKFDKY